MKRYFPVLEYVNLPNIITTLGLLFGIAACYFLTEGNLRYALICLFFSMSADVIDGIAASKLNRQTLFGRYLDTLVDTFICCIIPVFVAFTFLEKNIPLAIVLAFYCVCGLWRLARFNVIAAEKRPYFTGLPVPGAAMFVLLSVWSVVYYNLPAWLCGAVFFLSGLLMVSSVKMKKYGVAQKASWVIGVAFLVVIAMS